MKQADDIFNLSASDQKQRQLLESLGMAIVSFQYLEDELTRTVGDLCCPEDYEAGEIITAELSFKGLCNLASSMLRHRYKNEKQAIAFDKILSRCFSIEAQRNQLLHSTYGFGDFMDPDPIFSREKLTAKYKKGRNHTHKTVSCEELSDFSESCTKVSCDIADFLNSIK